MQCNIVGLYQKNRSLEPVEDIEFEFRGLVMVRMLWRDPELRTTYVQMTEREDVMFIRPIQPIIRSLDCVEVGEKRYLRR
jgi:hypothetical protein